MASVLDNINTIVLVMMENRSFDHMLGHLSIDDPNADVDGLKAPLDKYSNDYNGTLYPVYPISNDVELDFDVPHEFDAVATQLRKNPANGKYTMEGFAQAYAMATHTSNPENIAMSYFTADKVPITNFLAKNFCCCDRWFAPLPTSTQPNRTMAFSGDAPNHDTKKGLIPLSDNIFKWMDNNSVRWRVYHDGFPFFALYRTLWPYVLGPKFRRYEQLFIDMQQEDERTAPQVIIIEPNYEDGPHFGSKHPNDNHAPLAIGWGEDFIRRTYQAIIANNKRWAKTAMIVYYDEHGGFYDHVPPPSVTYTTTKDKYKFESLGVRIPGIIVSPFVNPGAFHQVLDHTSVLQFLAEKFTPGKPYSASVDKRKQAGVHSISEAMNATGLITSPPAPPTVAIEVKTALGKSISVAQSSDMRQSFTNATMKMMEENPAETAAKFPELFQWRDAAMKRNSTIN